MMRIVILFFLGGVGLSQQVWAGAKYLKIACGTVGFEGEACRSGVDRWSEKSGLRVQIHSAPTESNDRLALYQKLLDEKSPEVDVFQIDVVWPGSLQNHLVDLNQYFTKKDLAAFISVGIVNNTVGKRLVALPWFIHGGMLYYRKDLLKRYGYTVPQTWAQLELISKKIMKAENPTREKKLWGFVFQGRPYEGLTCNALEWIYSFGGGAFIDRQGQVTLNNPQAIKALSYWSSWIGEISPPGVLNYVEEDGRNVFQSGHAIFMRNWPYVWALLSKLKSPVQGKVGIAPLPSLDSKSPPASTLGGWSLAVSKYSKHLPEAIDLVRFLTSYKEQKRRLLMANYYPSRKALYEDKEVLKKVPYLRSMKKAFRHTVARPGAQVGTHYDQVTRAIWTSTHQVLSKKVPAPKALTDLEKKLKGILR